MLRLNQIFYEKMINIVFLLLIFIFKCIARLPYFILFYFGGSIAWINYLLNSRYRHYHTNNLAIACQYFDSSLTLNSKHFKKLLNNSIRHSGIQALELIQTWFGDSKSNFNKIVKISGEQLISNHQGSILFLSGHLGNFELSGRFLANLAPTVTLFRPPRHKLMRKVVTAGRSFPQMQLVPTDKSGVKAMIKALRSNGRVALLPDQVPQFGEGIGAKFFGKEAWTMSLAARLSEVADLTLFLRMERLEHAQGYHLHIESAIKPLIGDTIQRCDIINQTIEWQIWQNPSQYLWSYNRYKVPAGVIKPVNVLTNCNTQAIDINK